MATDTRPINAFHTEVADRFGVLPNFFRTAAAAPGLIDELWGFAKSAYLDSALPSLFKERLFVQLSRFCEIRYCIVRHVGFLVGLGRPAGDADATPESIDDVIELLSRPIPDAAQLAAVIDRLSAGSRLKPLPGPRTQAELDLFDALTVIFVEPARSDRAREAVRLAVGDAMFEMLAAYLAFVRTAHFWTETHPELAYEADMLALMEQRPDLQDMLLSPADAERVRAGGDLRRVLPELHQTEAALRESEARYRGFVNASADVVYRMSPDWSQMRELDGRGFIADTRSPSEDWRDRYILPDDRNLVQRAIEAAIAARGMFALEHRVIRADGSIGWTASRAVPILDDAGAIVEWIGTASDVTERKQAAAALHESEARHRLLIDSWAQAEWETDAEGVARVRIVPDGRRQLIDFVLPGDIIGNWGFSDPLASSTVMALTDLTVCRLPQASTPQLERAYAISRALDEAYLMAQVVRLGRLDASDRLIDLLLELDERLALAGLSIAGAFEMPITQEVIADALGLTSVHVNRTVQQARKRGDITWTGRGLRLRDIDALRRSLGRELTTVTI